MLSKEILQAEIPQMRRLYKALFSKGKGLRSQLTITVANFLNIHEKHKKQLSQIVEYIHQASILHDDVIDSSPVRRGDLSSWRQFSMKKSILAGDYLLAQAAMDTANLSNIALIKLTAQVLKKLVLGEWLQDSLKQNETMSQLQTVHELKTASLFQWCLKAPFLLTHCYDNQLHQCLDRIGLLIGVLFQRADDLLDFNIRNKEGKPVFKDLIEGNINSFAVLLSKNQVTTNELKHCRNLAEVKQLLGGETPFQKILLEFDKMNQQMIHDCQNQINQLKKYIPQKQWPLVQELRNWPHQLYWRTNV